MGRPAGTKNVMRTTEEKEKLVLEYFNSNVGYRKFAESNDIYPSTFCKWIRLYRKNGIEGLKTKPRSGRPGSLSNEDKEILDAIFLETPFLTTEKAHKIIKETFGFDFTDKHVRTILHQLDYYYSEPYTKFKESSEEERILFKKNEKIR